MQAIIFANRLGDELTPLNHYYCPALLPVGNKAVIDYTLEDIASAGITQIKLVISPQAKEIEQHLASGEKWGVEIEYFLSKPEEETSAVLKRLSLDAQDKLLLARGDIFRSPSIAQFIEFSKAFPDNFVQAKMANQNAGMMLLPAALPHIADLNWPLCHQGNDEAVVTLVLHGHCCMLDSFQSYMDTNLSLAANEFPSLTPMERSYNSANPEQDFYVGAKARTGQLNEQQGWGILGENAWIDPSVIMKNCILVGNDCQVDKGSILNNCLVLPHTYVGEGLEVKDSILCKNLLINVRTEGVIEIDDQALIGSCEVAVKGGTDKTGLITRFLLLILLTLSLPLWPLLQAVSFINSYGVKNSGKNKDYSPKDLLSEPAFGARVTQSYKDNLGHTFQTWKWNISPMILALMPQLYYVICGRLDLFGSSPQISYSHGQATDRLGVFGPVQLLLDESAPQEERAMLALEFEANNDSTKYLSLLWRSLRVHSQSFGFNPSGSKQRASMSKFES